MRFGSSTIKYAFASTPPRVEVKGKVTHRKMLVYIEKHTNLIGHTCKTLGIDMENSIRLTFQWIRIES